MHVILFLLLLSAFVGPYAFIVYPKLHLFRILPPAFAFFHAKTKVKLTGPLTLIIIFFSVYFVYTLAISLFYFRSIALADVANFIFLHFFILSIILAILSNPQKFLKTFKVFLFCFIVASFMIAIYEEATLNHLPYSTMNLEPKRWPDRHMPTTFFSNPNDYAAVYLMATMFLLSTFSTARRAVQLIIQGALILSCSWIIFITDSKINMLAFLVFVLYYFQAWKPKRILQIIAITILGVVINLRPILRYIEAEKSQIFTFTVVEGGSIWERWQMIRFGWKSVSDSYTFGFGVNSAQRYYQQFVGHGLTGMTTDPHNYIIEMLINSGLWIVICYGLLNLILLNHLLKKKAPGIMTIQFCLYNFILLASSSSIFLWPHYVFFIAYVCYFNEAKPQTQPSRINQ